MTFKINTLHFIKLLTNSFFISEADLSNNAAIKANIFMHLGIELESTKHPLSYSIWKWNYIREWSVICMFYKTQYTCSPFKDLYISWVSSNSIMVIHYWWTTWFSRSSEYKLLRMGSTSSPTKLTLNFIIFTIDHMKLATINTTVIIPKLNTIYKIYTSLIAQHEKWTINKFANGGQHSKLNKYF